MARSKQQLARLIRGALGEVKADLIVSGGKLINVYSREFLPGVEIAVLDGWICCVGSSARHTRDDETENRLKEMGSSLDKPIFALNFLPFVTLPALRITARGLVNVKERRIVSLFAG